MTKTGESPLELLARAPITRLLEAERGAIKRLVERGVERLAYAGERLLRRGEPARRVYLSLSAGVAVLTPAVDGTGPVLVAAGGRGFVVGLADAIEGRAAAADHVVSSSGRVLEFSAAATRELLAAGASRPRLSLRVGQARAPRVVVHGSRGLGVTTLAYALAYALRRRYRVSLVDLDGEESAKRLGLPTRPGGVVIDTPPSWGVRVATTARAPLTSRAESSTRREALPLRILAGRTEQLSSALNERDVEIFVSRSSARASSLDGSSRVVVRRVGESTTETTEAAATGPNAVRMLTDAFSPAEFWTHGEIGALVDPAHPYGRAVNRVIRALDGRSVGLALGGGGALGFANIGVLRALEDARIPVDALAGSSCGALIAAVYAGGGSGALDELLRRRRELVLALATAAWTTRPFATLVESIVGRQRLGSLELPFLPAGLDLDRGEEFVLDVGTLGDGVRASASLPGAAPPFLHGGRRIYDAGIVNLVPVSLLRARGLSFVIGSSVLAAPARARSRQRWGDWIRGMYRVMEVNAKRSTATADFVFQLERPEFGVYDFHRVTEIADAAYRHASRRLDELRARYERPAVGLLP